MDRNHSATNSSARATSTAVPAVPAKRRRWYQFSLRTMIVMTVAVSVLLGLFAARLQRARKQTAAVTLIHSHGGDVLYDFEVDRDRDGNLVHNFSRKSSFPPWMLRSLGQDFFHSVVVAEVRFERVSSQTDLDEIARATGDLRNLEVLTFFAFDGVPSFESFRNLTKVRDLTVTVPPIRNRDFKVIGAMKNLEVLHFSHQRIDGDAASHLGLLPHLRKFTAINGSMVADEALEHLARCRTLKQLTICHTDITDVGVRHLATLPQLEWLDLDGTQISDAGLDAVTKIETLRLISLGGTKVTGKGIRWPNGLIDAWLSETPLTDEGLQGLSRCRELTRLELGDTKVSNAGIGHIVTLRHLEWLELQGTKVSDDGLACLANLPALQHVSLDRTCVTDRGLAHLAGLKRIESLNLFDTKVTGEKFDWPRTLTRIHLSGSPLTDAGLMRLAKCPKLKDLLVERTAITNEGLATFQKTRGDVNLTGY